MNIEELKNSLPATAKDLRLNLGSVLRSEHLTPRQALGTLVATAHAARNVSLLEAAQTEARAVLDRSDIDLALSIATTMAMNNVYYRFVHLVGDDAYGTLPARLRMQALAAPENDKLDRELWALAVSAVNGCGMCMSAHEKALVAAGATREQVQDSVRIAAVVAATAAALDCAVSTDPAL